MAFRGFDLVELWQSRRWRYLLNLIDHLPRTSHFSEAVAEDEELAEAQPRRESEHKERISEWTPEKELLAAVFDRLGDVIAALVAVNGGNPPDIARYPRPVTASQRAQVKNTQSTHEKLVNRLLRR